MGCFMAASGLLTLFAAVPAVAGRHKETTGILDFAGLARVGTMSSTNFVIDSNVKWMLLASAAVWFAGVAFCALEARA
jgi:hypothetical protein